MAPNPLCVRQDALWLDNEQFSVMSALGVYREELASRAEHFPKYDRKVGQNPKRARLTPLASVNILQKTYPNQVSKHA
jgi:hypothetical protein